jgi:hypothetical protein
MLTLRPTGLSPPVLSPPVSWSLRKHRIRTVASVAIEQLSRESCRLCKFGTARRHLFATLRECATAVVESEYGVRTMTRLAIEIVQFFCMSAIVSGIVIAAAKVIG